MNIFKSIFKKNQIIVFTIGLMIITAGYLSYMNNNKEGDNSFASSSIADSEEMASIGDAKLVSANVAENTNNINSNNVNEEADSKNDILTNSINTNKINENINNIDTLEDDVSTYNNIYAFSIYKYYQIFNSFCFN